MVQATVDNGGSESWVPFVTTIVIICLAFGAVALVWKLARLTLFRSWWTSVTTVVLGAALMIGLGWVDLAGIRDWLGGEEAEDLFQFWGPVALPALFLAVLFSLLVVARVLRGVLRRTLFRNWWTSLATVAGFIAAMAIGGAVRNIVGLIFTLSIFDLLFSFFSDDSDPPASGPGDFGELPGSRYWRERAEQEAGRPLPDGDYGPGSGWA